jgi:hypothetical protein
MNTHIATFHSHFGALSYFKALTKQGVSAKLMPVPRKVSSSCGTCVYYEHVSAIDLDGCELDSVYLEANNALECVLRK